MSETLDEIVQRALDKLPPEPDLPEPEYTPEMVKLMTQYLIDQITSGKVKI